MAVESFIYRLTSAIFRSSKNNRGDPDAHKIAAYVLEKKLVPAINVHFPAVSQCFYQVYIIYLHITKNTFGYIRTIDV
jgi:hypothetical protein